MYVSVFSLMITVAGTKRFERELLYVRIPVKYWNLQSIINAKAAYYRRHKEKGPPILSWDEITKWVIVCTWFKTKVQYF